MEKQYSSPPKFRFGNIEALHKHVLKSMETGQLDSSMELEYEGQESLDVLLEKIFTFCTPEDPSFMEAHKKWMNETGIQVENPPICEPSSLNQINSAINNIPELPSETPPSISPCLSEDKNTIEDLTSAGAVNEDSTKVEVDIQNPTNVKEIENDIPWHESKEEITKVQCQDSLKSGEELVLLDLVPVDPYDQLDFTKDYSQLEMCIVLSNPDPVANSDDATKQEFEILSNINVLQRTISSDEESFYSAVTNLSAGSDQFEVDDKIHGNEEEVINAQGYLVMGEKVTSADPLKAEKIDGDGGGGVELGYQASILLTEKLTTESAKAIKISTAVKVVSDSVISETGNSKVQVQSSRKRRLKVNASETSQANSVVKNYKEDPTITQPNYSELILKNAEPKISEFVPNLIISDVNITKAKPLMSHVLTSLVNQSPRKTEKISTFWADNDGRTMANEGEIQILQIEPSSESSGSSVSKSINKRRKLDRSAATYSSDDDDIYVSLPRPPIDSLDDIQTPEENSTPSEEEGSTSSLSNSNHSSLSSNNTSYSPSKARTTQKIYIQRMNKEMKESAPNLKILKELLDITRTNRMEYLLRTKYNVKNGFEKCPALSLYSLMKYEFSRMNGKSTNRVADLEAQLKVEMDTTVTKGNRFPGRNRHKIWKTALKKMIRGRRLSREAKNVLGMICLCFTFVKDSATEVFEIPKPGQPVDLNRLLCPTLVVMDTEELFKEEAQEMWIYCDRQKCISVPNFYQGILTIYSMYYVFNIKYNPKLEVLFDRFDEIISQCL